MVTLNSESTRNLTERKKFLKKSLGLEGLIPEIFDIKFDVTCGYSAPDNRIRSKGILSKTIANFRGDPYTSQAYELTIREGYEHYLPRLRMIFSEYDSLYGTKTKFTVTICSYSTRQKCQNLK